MKPMNIKLKLIAASLTTAIAVLGVTQIAGAQKTAPATPATVTAPASTQGSAVDTPETGDTADVAGATDTAEVGDVPDAAGDTETADGAEAGETADAAEPAGADTDNVQQGDQSGPETPDVAGATSK
ncbi:hypothetical protein GCM10017781_37600 [Deinococcus metalli]|uniref:Uncharacterized protein n=2 Tax=Deinococcus metalli TaxID=1141878 RepID=A0ABQ3JYT9_9DEIO|nr:hypothetical protein GCM10017781_37600 [Deinococcus metalli]